MSTRGKRSQTAQCCWRSSRALEVKRQVGSPARNQSTSRPVIERPLEGTSTELDTASRMRCIRMDTHDVRNARPDADLLSCHRVTVRPTTKKRVRDQVYITCCCEFLVRSGFLSSRVALAQRLFVARTRCAFKPFGSRVEILDLRLSGKHIICLCHEVIHDRASGVLRVV